VNLDLRGHVDGLRSILIFFLGLNVAWMETSYNAVVMNGVDTLLGWPPLELYLTAGEWFWIHLVLTMATAALLVYSYELSLRGENLQ